MLGEEKPLEGTLVEFVSTTKVKDKSRDKDPLDFNVDYVTNTNYLGTLSYSEGMELIDEKGEAVLRRELPDLDARLVAEAKLLSEEN